MTQAVVFAAQRGMIIAAFTYADTTSIHSPARCEHRGFFTIFLLRSQRPSETVHHYGADALGLPGGGLREGAARGLT